MTQTGKKRKKAGHQAAGLLLTALTATKLKRKGDDQDSAVLTAGRAALRHGACGNVLIGAALWG